MLGDTIVKYARRGIEKGLLVELEVGSIQLTAISSIEHLDDDLIMYRYVGMDVEHYVLASTIKMLRVREKDDWS